MKHLTDPQTGDVIHCEYCEMYPATHERETPGGARYECDHCAWKRKTEQARNYSDYRTNV